MLDMKKLSMVILGLVGASYSLPDQAIWSGKLVNGWQDWSWAKVDKSGPTMKVTAKAWQGVYYHHDPEKSSSFTSLTFQVNGGTKGGQHIQLRATVNKQPLKEAFLPALKPGWNAISVSMKKLSLTGQAFDGLWIQAQKDASFEIKNVKLKS